MLESINLSQPRCIWGHSTCSCCPSFSAFTLSTCTSAQDKSLHSPTGPFSVVERRKSYYNLLGPACHIIGGFTHWLTGPDYGKGEREAQQISVDVSKYLYFSSQKGVDCLAHVPHMRTFLNVLIRKPANKTWALLHYSKLHGVGEAISSWGQTGAEGCRKAPLAMGKEDSKGLGQQPTCLGGAPLWETNRLFCIYTGVILCSPSRATRAHHSWCWTWEEDNWAWCWPPVKLFLCHPGLP